MYPFWYRILGSRALAIHDQMIDEGNPAMRAFLADQLLQDIKAPLSKEEAKDIAKLTDGVVERLSDEEKAKIDSMGYGPSVIGPTEYISTSVLHRDSRPHL